ncbi:uncharacterized protein FFB20_12810 [Fusarium fujikuroi]|uniref:Uncharacterized protein n=1 Tax=Fusarium fujikuroi TaxID=5127 RepID=A0A9Q9RZE7_FUSFU|nr:uncharacterized protein FFE2_00612 [Fusarium fujikuroi]SCO07282.1 uncharacterized protein FFB20_12810 [Fusarium fujikuroi]VTT82509.1 unnamed protein product [Fusarium fujikuroi]VTT82618.1 unnamed protein product [Fusarium fujikuroi]VZH87273.1 unnamed protein product [Fusarium fujikuroi]
MSVTFRCSTPSNVSVYSTAGTRLTKGPWDEVKATSLQKTIGPPSSAASHSDQMDHTTCSVTITA